MPQTYADLTISEVLSDPLINAVMRADQVTRHDLELLLKSAARKGFDAATSQDWERAYGIEARWHHIISGSSSRCG